MGEIKELSLIGRTKASFLEENRRFSEDWLLNFIRQEIRLGHVRLDSSGIFRRKHLNNTAADDPPLPPRKPFNPRKPDKPRTCRGCNTTYLSIRDGFSSYGAVFCKTCQANRKALHVQTCILCHEEKPLTKKYFKERQRKGVRGWSKVCRECEF